MNKKVFSVLVILFIAACTLFAADWWESRKINSYDVTGTVNVDRTEVLDVLYEFRGKELSNDLLSEIESKLYSIKGVDYIEMSLSEKDDQAKLSVAITELPVVSKIIFEGNSKVRTSVLKSGLTVIKQDDFFDSSKKSVLDSAVKQLVTLCQTKGLPDATVSYEVSDGAKNGVNITFKITEGVQSKITSINYEGNKNISASALKKKITSTVKGLFNKGFYVSSTVSQDAEAIANYYKTCGYIDVVIKDIRVTEKEVKDGERFVDVTFVIDEGLKWYYGGMEVSGNKVFSDEEISKLLTLENGAVLDMEKVQAQYTSIEDLYMDQGYMFNSWDMQTERNDKEMTVKFYFYITEGPQATVDEIWITGLKNTKDYVLRRELSLKEGDVFSKTKFVTSARSLYNTGLLSDLDTKTYAGTKENSVIVEFVVEEGSQKDIQFGATFGGNTSGFPISGFLEWTDRNLMGKGQDFSISLSIADSAQSLSFSFGDDWFKDLRWANSIGLSFSREALTDQDVTNIPEEDAVPNGKTMDYDLYSISLNYSSGYSFVWDPGTLALSAGVSLSLNRVVVPDTYYGIYPADYNHYLYSEKFQFSNKITFGASWDGRDNATNTSKGYIASLSGVYAGGFMFGLSNYIKVTGSASGYLKLFEIPIQEETRNVMLCATTTLSAMFDNYSFNEKHWVTRGSTSEYFSIDGMTIARGHGSVTKLKFLWDNTVEISFPIVEGIVNFEAFASATAARPDISLRKGLDWYFAAGVGGKLKISGFPLGVYVVYDFTHINGAWNFKPEDLNGTKIGNSPLSVVLAISTSLI